MDQNLGRAALNLLPKTGEFLFENLAARPFPQRAYIKNISFIMKPFGVTTEVWVTLVLSPRSSNVYAASMSNCLPIITTVCAVGR